MIINILAISRECRPVLYTKDRKSELFIKKLVRIRFFPGTHFSLDILRDSGIGTFNKMPPDRNYQVYHELARKSEDEYKEFQDEIEKLAGQHDLSPGFIRFGRLMPSMRIVIAIAKTASR